MKINQNQAFNQRTRRKADSFAKSWSWILWRKIDGSNPACHYHFSHLKMDGCLEILCDLFGMVKWPFQGLSDLQIGDKKVTLNHLVEDFFVSFWDWRNLAGCELLVSGSEMTFPVQWTFFSQKACHFSGLRALKIFQKLTDCCRSFW